MTTNSNISNSSNANVNQNYDRWCLKSKESKIDRNFNVVIQKVAGIASAALIVLSALAIPLGGPFLGAATLAVSLSLAVV